MKRLKVTVEGKAYQVTVEPLAEGEAAPTTIAPPPNAPAAAQTPPTTGGTSVPSPLAGKVVTIDVATGQNVAEGDQLMVLEAMKMNTYIYAPQAGNIANILVSEGDTVEEGQALVSMA